MKRVAAHARRSVVQARRKASAVRQLYRPQYRGFRNAYGFPLENIRGPLTRVPLNRDLLHTFDFLPDRFTLTGTAMADTPHAEFARAYLANPGADLRATAYYRRTVDGSLAVPSAGIPHAEWRMRNFAYVVEVLKHEGYRPERGALTVVELSDGRLMLVNGKHRAATLLALGATEAEVVILPANEFIALVEPQVKSLWPDTSYGAQHALLRVLGKPLAADQRRVSALLDRIRSAKLEEEGDIYHPIPFPEFQNLRVMSGSHAAYQRLGIILRHHDRWAGAEVLDIGCNLGFYSFSLARRGAITTGIEIRSDYVDVSREIADIYGVPSTFVNSPVTPELIRSKPGGYDVALCFSMLQWVIEQQGEAFGLEVLRAISDSARELFFDVAVNSGRAQLRCPRGHEIAYVYDLLRRGTGYARIEYVGEAEPWGEARYVFHCSH